VVLAAADIESLQIAGTGIEAGPIPRLNPEWVEALDDGTPGFRLAVALGLGAAGYTKEGQAIDPLRHHWLPLDSSARRFVTQDRGLAKDARVVGTHRHGTDSCIAVVERRLVEAARRSDRLLPIAPATRAAARLEDLVALVTGQVDLDRCVKLARSVMAVDHRRWAASSIHLRLPSERTAPDPAWSAIRLALLPWALDADHKVPADPAIIRRLASGRAAEAVQLALRRLSAVGLRPAIRTAGTSRATAKLWAAALAFPVDRYAIGKLLKQMNPSATEQAEFTKNNQEIDHAP
jgi:CRISPR-associated protein Csx17